MLDLAQHGLDLLQVEILQLRHQTFVEIFERHTEIAALIDTIDDGEGDLTVALAEMRHVHLPGQMIAQRFGRSILVLELPPFGIAALSVVGNSGIVDILPHAVDRQILGEIADLRIGNRLAVGIPGNITGGIAATARHIVETGQRAVHTVEIPGCILTAAGRRFRAVLTVRLAGTFAFVTRTFFGKLQHRVRIQRFLDLLAQIDRGQLQQADGLLQLGSHGQMLTKAYL